MTEEIRLCPFCQAALFVTSKYEHCLRHDYIFDSKDDVEMYGTGDFVVFVHLTDHKSFIIWTDTTGTRQSFQIPFFHLTPDNMQKVYQYWHQQMQIEKNRNKVIS